MTDLPAETCASGLQACRRPVQKMGGAASLVRPRFCVMRLDTQSLDTQSRVPAAHALLQRSCVSSSREKSREWASVYDCFRPGPCVRLLPQCLASCTGAHILQISAAQSCAKLRRAAQGKQVSKRRQGSGPGRSETPSRVTRCMPGDHTISITKHRCMPGNRRDSAAGVQGLDSASADDKLARRDEVSRHGCPHDAQDAGAGRAAVLAYGSHLCSHMYASYCAPCRESQRDTSYVGPTWVVALILRLHCSWTG